MREKTMKERIEAGKMFAVAGGKDEDSAVEGRNCNKPGRFKPLEGKANGCPQKCKNCWHLKFENGFYCDA